MACSIVYLITPPAPPALPAVSVATASNIALMGASLAAAGVFTYLAVRELRKEYQASMAAFNQRSAAARMYMEESTCQYAETVLAALNLAEATFASVDVNVAECFLLHQLDVLAKRLATNPHPDAPDMVARCQALRARVIEPSSDLDTAFIAYNRLSEEIAASIPQVTVARATVALVEEIAATRAEIAASPLAADAYAALREELETQLQTLEGLAERQFRIATQGLVLLRQRVNREIAVHFMREKQRLERAEAFRSLVNETLARLTAMTSQTVLPVYAVQARVHLDRLNEILAAGEGAEESLTDLADKVSALFSACEVDMTRVADEQVVQGRLQETVLALGMVLRERAAEDARRSVIAGLGDDRGIEFLFESDGRIRAEMVAFTEQAKIVMPEEIEDGLATADDIMRRLGETDVKVRERYRHLHKHLHGHDLRVVDVTETEVQSARAGAPAQKEMRVNE
jgi:hypothetical protein